MTRIIKRPLAKQDLIEQADFIAQDNLDAALRFLDAAEKTFAHLARLPRIGKSRKVKSQVFANIRQFPITGFEKYLVFYRPIKSGIEVLRILSTMWAMLGSKSLSLFRFCFLIDCIGQLTIVRWLRKGYSTFRQSNPESSPTLITPCLFS